MNHIDPLRILTAGTMLLLASFWCGFWLFQARHLIVYRKQPGLLPVSAVTLCALVLGGVVILISAQALLAPIQ